MKGFVKVVVWIVVLAAICVGVYFILPEYPQSYVKSIFQPMTDAAADLRIGQVQNMLNDELDKATYKTILEAKTKNPCWVYKMDEVTGAESVTFYGRGVTINLQDYRDYQGKLSTSAMIKVVFDITGNKVQIHPYVDGVLMELNDESYEEKNKEIRTTIFRQMYTGNANLEQ